MRSFERQQLAGLTALSVVILAAVCGAPRADNLANINARYSRDIDDEPTAPGFIIMKTGGLAKSTGTLDDYLLSTGFVFGIRAYIEVQPKMYLGAGFHYGLFLGESEPGDSAWSSNGAFSLSFEGGGMFYLLDPGETQIRPFLAAHLGVGWMVVSYDDHYYDGYYYHDTYYDRNDTFSFVYVVPEAGIDVRLTHMLSARAGARVLLTRYFDDSTNNPRWDWNGNFLEMYIAGVLTFKTFW